MSDNSIIAIAITFFFCVGILGGILVAEVNWREAAIEHGCGQYNAKTADFEWLPNKEVIE